MNKEFDKIFRTLQVEAYLKNELLIPDNIKQELYDIGQEINNVSFSPIEYFYKIKIGKKNYSIKITHGWRTNLSFNVTLNKSYFNKYLYKGHKFISINDIMEDEVADAFQKAYSVSLSNKEFKKLSIEKVLDKVHFSYNNFYNFDRVEFIKDILLTKSKIKVSPEVVKIREFFKNKTTHTGWSTTFVFVKKVYEINDKRFAIIENIINDKIKIIGITPANDLYNYIDENRFIYMEDFYNSCTNPYWFAFDILENMADFEQYADTYRKYVVNNRKAEISVNNQYIDGASLLSAGNKIKLELKKKEREHLIIDAKNNKWKIDIKNMNEKPLVQNGISFKDNVMKYEGITLNTNGLFSFKKYFKQKSVDDLADYNSVLNNFFSNISIYFMEQYPSGNTWNNELNKSYITKDIWDEKSISFTLDKKEITISRKNNFYYINDIRINKMEIYECLEHILCHQEVDKYETFLKSVSKCSLKFHNAIANNIKKSFNRDTIELKIKRKKNRNYLLVGKDEYNISNTNELINFDVYNMNEFVIKLLTYVNIPLIKIKPLIKEAKERFENALKKSEEFLKKAIKIVSAEKKTMYYSGDRVEGYFLTGKSGNGYLIEDKETFKVYEVKGETLEYRCIIDKTKKGQMGKDALVSRLFALKNDVMVANEVHTLRV